MRVVGVCPEASPLGAGRFSCCKEHVRVVEDELLSSSVPQERVALGNIQPTYMHVLVLVLMGSEPARHGSCEIDLRRDGLAGQDVAE